MFELLFDFTNITRIKMTVFFNGNEEKNQFYIKKKLDVSGKTIIIIIYLKKYYFFRFIEESNLIRYKL